MPLSLPRRFWLLLGVFGVILAAIFAVLPVGVDFRGDTLLRLREFDPELSPPATTADCGSPITHLDPAPSNPSFYEVARAGACERAAKRRLFGSVAAGSILVMIGWLGMNLAVPNPRLTLERVERKVKTPQNAGVPA